MLQVLVSLICTQASQSIKQTGSEVLSLCQDLLDNSALVKCDIYRPKTQITSFDVQLWPTWNSLCRP